MNNIEALFEYRMQICKTPQQELPQQTVGQIIMKSREENMQSTVPKDASERFYDEKAYQAWTQKGKFILCLLKQNDLSGLVWFSQSRNELTPEAESTFAIRIYEGYSGRGLARPLMALSHELLPKFVGVSGNVWLETDQDNLAAQNLYSSFGYRDVGVSDGGRIVMEYHSNNES